MALYRRKEAGMWYADYIADGKRVQELLDRRSARVLFDENVSRPVRDLRLRKSHAPIVQVWKIPGARNLLEGAVEIPCKSMERAA